MDEQLDRVPLGRTGLTVTRLGLGTAPLASIFWGNDEARGVATAARAVERGIRLFDSAPLYGLGESETRLGRALATIDRDDVVVATKAGRSLVASPRSPSGGTEAVFDFSHDATLRQLESSMERLGLDRIDIVHIHDPEDHLAEAIDGTYAALDRLRARRRRRRRLGRHERRRDGTLLPAQRRPRLRDGGRSPHAPRPVGGRRPRPRVPTGRRRVPRRGCVQQRRARRPADRVRGSTTRPRRATCSSGQPRSEPSASRTACRCAPRRCTTR